MTPPEREARPVIATGCMCPDEEHCVREQRARIRMALTDIRSWTQGLHSSLDGGEIRSADLDTLEVELRAVEERLEAVTSLVVLDR